MAALWTPHAEAQAELLRWAERRLPLRFDDHRSLATAVVLGDEIAAVVVYNQHRDCNIEMSIAADTPRWATRGTIAAMLAPPFEALGCRRITAIVHSDNRRSRRFVEGIGFHFEGSMRDAFKDGDAIVYGMTRRWWLASRWNQGRQLARRAA